MYSKPEEMNWQPITYFVNDNFILFGDQKDSLYLLYVTRSGIVLTKILWNLSSLLVLFNGCNNRLLCYEIV